MGQEYFGIDISNHQPPSKIDMPTVSKNTDYMFHKASEGTGFTDRYWAGRSGWSRDNSYPIGAYHFARPDQHGWKAEADFFLSKLDGKEAIAPCLDWEHKTGIQSLGKQGATNWCLGFLNYVGEQLGVTPWFYTSYYIARDMMTHDRALGQFPLWEAWYATNDDHGANQARVDSGWKPPVPPQWDSISMWQYSSAARNIPGTSGVRIDCNTSYVAPWNADVSRPPKKPPVVTPPPVDDSPTPLLSAGSRGEKVTTLQKLLSGAGFETATDGVFGPGTTASVKAYQTSKGLTADGVAGPRTWAALLAFLGGGKPELGVDYDGYVESIKTAPGKINVLGWGIDPKNVPEVPEFRLLVDGKAVKHFKGNRSSATDKRIIDAKPQYKGGKNLGFSIKENVDPGKHQIAVHVKMANGSYVNLWQSPQSDIVVPNVPKPAPVPVPVPVPDPADPKDEAIKALRARFIKLQNDVADAIRELDKI